VQILRRKQTCLTAAAITGFIRRPFFFYQQNLSTGTRGAAHVLYTSRYMVTLVSDELTSERLHQTLKTNERRALIIDVLKHEMR